MIPGPKANFVVFVILQIMPKQATNENRARKVTQTRKSKLWPEIATPIVPGALLNDDSTLGAIGLVLRPHGRLSEE
jgi:hypothetical protein